MPYTRLGDAPTKWQPIQDLNLEPLAPEANALSVELMGCENGEPGGALTQVTQT